MRFSENRPIAWAVLAVCVIGSVFGLGGGSVAGERAKIVTVFNKGTESSSTTRSSMDAYLDRAAEQAQLMANEAMILLGNDDATANEMLTLAPIISDNDDLDARYDAYTRVKDDSDKLYNAIYAKFDKAKTKNFKAAYDDFWEAEKFIKHDQYRTMAADFNTTLKGFPAGLITSIHGIKPLNSFGAD